MASPQTNPMAKIECAPGVLAVAKVGGRVGGRAVNSPAGPVPRNRYIFRTVNLAVCPCENRQLSPQPPPGLSLRFSVHFSSGKFELIYRSLNCFYIGCTLGSDRYWLVQKGRKITESMFGQEKNVFLSNYVKTCKLIWID